MRGSPILRAIAALIVLLALGYPLHQLLRPEVIASPVSPAIAPAKSASKQSVHLQISFTQPPRRLRVLSLGKPVWEVPVPTAEMERDLAMAYPPEGVELQFELDWPEESRAAARVHLTDPEGVEHDGFIWAQGATTEVLTFH